MASTISRLRGRGSPTESPPTGVAIGIEIKEGGGAFAAEVGEHGTLDDGEEGVASRAFRDAGLEMPVGLLRPAHGAMHAFTGVFVADRILGALVEHHEDVAAEGELGIDGGFGREGVGAAIEVRLKGDAMLGDFAQAGEAEDLEAARIGEDGVGPGHEAMEAAEGTDELVAGAQIEVVGVGEEDGDAKVVGEIALRESFDGGLGADGHEDGGFDGSVRRVEQSGAGASVGAFGLEFEGDLGQV